MTSARIRTRGGRGKADKGTDKFAFTFVFSFSLSMRYYLLYSVGKSFWESRKGLTLHMRLCSFARSPCGCRILRLAPLQPTFTSCFASLLPSVPSPHSLAHSLHFPLHLLVFLLSSFRLPPFSSLRTLEHNLPPPMYAGRA